MKFFGVLKDHKKKVAVVLALLGVLAAFLTGDCDVACVLKTGAIAVGL